MQCGTKVAGRRIDIRSLPDAFLDKIDGCKQGLFFVVRIVFLGVRLGYPQPEHPFDDRRIDDDGRASFKQGGLRLQLHAKLYVFDLAAFFRFYQLDIDIGHAVDFGQRLEDHVALEVFVLRQHHVLDRIPRQHVVQLLPAVAIGEVRRAGSVTPAYFVKRQAVRTAQYRLVIKAELGIGVRLQHLFAYLRRERETDVDGAALVAQARGVEYRQAGQQPLACPHLVRRRLDLDVLQRFGVFLEKLVIPARVFGVGAQVGHTDPVIFLKAGDIRRGFHPGFPDLLRPEYECVIDAS